MTSIRVRGQTEPGNYRMAGNAVVGIELRVLTPKATDFLTHPTLYL